MGRVAGRVAFITGGARGQGRAHAVRLAQEGAAIVVADLAGGHVDGAAVPTATAEDLASTVRAVEEIGGRILADVADVRDYEALRGLAERGANQFGPIDTVIANAGILAFGRAWEITETEWRDMLDVNLTGVWHTVKAVVPSMIESGKGGAVVLVSSTAGVEGTQNMAHYGAAKHGVVGLMRSLANELGPHGIRVNAILPGPVATPMVTNQAVYQLLAPDNPTAEGARETLRHMLTLPVAWLEPEDIANAALWLVSDEARYVTGITVAVDAGWTNR